MYVKINSIICLIKFLFIIKFKSFSTWHLLQRNLSMGYYHKYCVHENRYEGTCDSRMDNGDYNKG